MQAAWQRWRWALLAAAVTLGGFAALLNFPAAFRVLGLREMKPVYADLVAVLAAGEAVQQGIDVYRGNPLDPFNRPHVYGPAWLVTGSLGLTRGDTGWLGTLLVLGFIGAAVALCAPRTPRAALLTVALLLSPPVVLALERGNNDLVIFLLLAGAAALLGRAGRMALPAATAALVTAAALKFYPLVCLPALATQRAGLRRALPWVIVGALAFVGVWFAQRVDLARVFALAPEPATIFAYGLRLGALTWRMLGGEHFWLLLGAAPVLTAGAGWILRSAPALRALVPLQGVAAAAAVAGIAGWIFCYVWTTNFPYRVLLLVLLAPVLLRPEAPRAAGQLLAGLLALGWLLAPLDWCATAFDADGTRTTLLHVLAVLTGAHQALVFIVSAAVAVVLIGWARRSWATGTARAAD